MTNLSYRPWGLLPWILERTSQSNWNLLGCLSTEERCLATLKTLKHMGKLAANTFFQIEDPPSRFEAIIKDKLQQRREDYKKLGANVSDIEEHELFDRIEKMVSRVN